MFNLRYHNFPHQAVRNPVQQYLENNENACNDKVTDTTSNFQPTTTISNKIKEIQCHHVSSCHDQRKQAKGR